MTPYSITSVSTWDLETDYLCNGDKVIDLTICSRASTAKVPIVSLNPTGDFNTSDVRMDDNGSPSWNKTIRIGIGSNCEIALDTEEKVEPEFCIYCPVHRDIKHTSVFIVYSATGLRWIHQRSAPQQNRQSPKGGATAWHNATPIHNIYY